MPQTFAPGEWDALCVEDRIKRCRLLAEQASTLAVHDKTAMRGKYNELAKRWRQLADEMQAGAAVHND